MPETRAAALAARPRLAEQKLLVTDGTAQDALAAIGHWLKTCSYHFTTVTPLTQSRINGRPGNQQARDLRDVFGWSRPFESGLLPNHVIDWLASGDLLEASGSLMRSKVRYSTLGKLLFAHSAYPTGDADAIFFGPDTVRFCALIEHELASRQLPAAARVVDVGCGAGPGGLVAASASGFDSCVQLHLTDINPQALVFARANAALAGVSGAAIQESNLFAALAGDFDLIVANPPYLVDRAERAYRHGGGPLGMALGERIVREGLHRLAPGGRLILYTGVPVINGRHPFLDAVEPHIGVEGYRYTYRELDPDVFGEELEATAYADTERIAAVALVIERSAGAQPWASRANGAAPIS